MQCTTHSAEDVHVFLKMNPFKLNNTMAYCSTTLGSQFHFSSTISETKTTTTSLPYRDPERQKEVAEERVAPAVVGPCYRYDQHSVLSGITAPIIHRQVKTNAVKDMFSSAHSAPLRRVLPLWIRQWGWRGATVWRTEASETDCLSGLTHNWTLFLCRY